MPSLQAAVVILLFSVGGVSSHDTSPADSLWNSLVQATTSAVSPSLEAVSAQLDALSSGQSAAQYHRDSISARLERLAVETDAALNSLQSQQGDTQQRVRELGDQLLGHAGQLTDRITDTNTSLSASLEDLRSQLSASAARDCSDLPADSPSGVYLITPGLQHRLPVFCDLETAGGGWTVFQRRADIQPREDFYRNWEDYKWGFGTLQAQFWWGLQHVWQMTSLLDRQYELRVDMEDFDGERRYALYQGFRVSSESGGFRLTVANYSGDSGDSLTGHSGHLFSTKDKDQDAHASSCAQAYKGGWWYNACHSSNLNGLYLSGNHSSYANGVNWHAWRGHHYSLKRTEMKIRPTLKL